MAPRPGLSRRESMALTAGAHAYKIHKVDELIAQEVTARFEATSARRRVTLSRMLTGGFLAFGATKRTGHFYLSFYDGEVMVRSVQIPPRREQSARLWVGQFNRAVLARRDAA
jgi:hypothetical protein